MIGRTECARMALNNLDGRGHRKKNANTILASMYGSTLVSAKNIPRRESNVGWYIALGAAVACRETGCRVVYV